MKIFIKVGLVLLGIAGVLYWLGGKFLQPARSLHARYKRSSDEDTTV